MGKMLAAGCCELPCVIFWQLQLQLQSVEVTEAVKDGCKAEG